MLTADMQLQGSYCMPIAWSDMISDLSPRQLNDAVHRQYHCKDFQNTQQTRRILRLEEAHSYVASMLTCQAVVVVMGYSIRGGKTPSSI